MGKQWITAAIIGSCLLLGTSAVARDHGRGRDEHKIERRDHHRDVRWDRDHDRDHGRDYDRRPPGWSKGKKTGWGNCDLPPGQAKKHGCYDRDDYRRRHEHRVYRDRVTTRPRTGGWRLPSQSTTTTTTTTTRKPGAWEVARERAKETSSTTTTQPAPRSSGGWKLPN